jgi:hypothetical protein
LSCMGPLMLTKVVLMLQTPILVSLVKKDAVMLDAFGKGASDDIRTSKDVLYRALTLNPETGDSECVPVQSRQKSPPVSPNRVRNLRVDVSTITCQLSVDDQHLLCILLRFERYDGRVVQQVLSSHLRLQSVASMQDAASASDTEAVAFTIPHMPSQSLADLHKLARAIKDLVAQIRPMLYSDGSYRSDSRNRCYSALNSEPDDYQQVRREYSIGGLQLLSFQERTLHRVNYTLWQSVKMSC